MQERKRVEKCFQTLVLVKVVKDLVNLRDKDGLKVPFPHGSYVYDHSYCGRSLFAEYYITRKEKDSYGGVHT